ncbi:translation initiation factor eIF-2B subunit alpha, putative, partial [Eimeria tenella]
MRVLTHGRSSCVETLLRNAWVNHKKRFEVFITQQDSAAADGDEACLLQTLAALKVPCGLFSVGAVSSLIREIDFVLVGAEAVVESGGIINR